MGASAIINQAFIYIWNQKVVEYNSTLKLIFVLLTFKIQAVWDNLSRWSGQAHDFSKI